MAKLPTPILAAIFSLVLVLPSCQAESHSEVEDEHEFSYDPNSEHGPAKWGKINPEWGACSNGKMQSPIDMSNERVHVVSNLGALKRRYKPVHASLKNRGHDMMLKWDREEAGTIEINSTKYVLKQCHWHSPSEHTINGKRYDLEGHMVHESEDGKIAVVGILYQSGAPDPFLSKLTGHLNAVTDTTESEITVGEIDPSHIENGSNNYYRYIGSLTVPPCTENVIWSIVKKVRTVSKDQINLLRVAVHDESDTNARPTQPTNDRPVQLFKSDDKAGN